MMTTEQLVDEFVDLIVPRLVQRGFVLNTGSPAPVSGASSQYDQATCERFLEGRHLGDSVLARAELFFGEIAKHGEISSPDLVSLLGLKGPTSLPANLTNPLKKSARRLGVEVPWETAERRD